MIYVAATYSNVEDKDTHIDDILRYMGEFMHSNPGVHLVSPLQHHHTLKLVPDMGSDYTYWKNFSRELLSKCDGLIVLMSEGWRESGGVQDEIAYAKELGIDILYINLY
jgi:hypothetical protein